MEGRIIYKDGGFSTGRFNISTLDQTIRYMDSDEKVMGIKDNASVDRASIGGLLFIRYRTYYLAFSLDIDGTYLCVSRRLVFKDEKKGAFGSESSTGNIKEVKRLRATEAVSMTSTEIHPMKSRTFLSFTGTRLLTLLLKNCC